MNDMDDIKIEVNLEQTIDIDKLAAQNVILKKPTNGPSIFDVPLSAYNMQPWLNRNANLQQWFNYGLTPETWTLYANRQLYLYERLKEKR